MSQFIVYYSSIGSYPAYFLFSSLPSLVTGLVWTKKCEQLRLILAKNSQEGVSRKILQSNSRDSQHFLIFSLGDKIRNVSLFPQKGCIYER